MLFGDSVDNARGLFLITKDKDSFLLAWKFTQILLPRIRSLDIFQQYDLFSLCLMFSLGGLPYVANSAWPVQGYRPPTLRLKKSCERSGWLVTEQPCRFTGMFFLESQQLEKRTGRDCFTILVWVTSSISHHPPIVFYLRQFWHGSPSPYYMVKYECFIKKRDSHVLLCSIFDTFNSLHVSVVVGTLLPRNLVSPNDEP